MWPWRLKVRILLFTLMWLITDDQVSKKSSLQYFLILKFISKIYILWSYVKKYSIFIKLIHKVNSPLLHSKYQQHIIRSNNNELIKTTKTCLVFKKNSLNKKHYFFIFLKTSLKPIKSIYKVHPSMKQFFVSYTKYSTSVYSITHLHAKWLNFYNLVYYLLFYKLPLLFFGNNFFKQEILTLNFQFKQLLYTHWMFLRPYFFVKKNLINNYNNQIFSLLKLKKINIAFVMDTNYHKHTLFYLKKYYFFTIGVVPVTNNIHIVDFAVPSNSTNTYSHLFFIRFILNIKKDIAYADYINYRSLW